MRAVAVAVVRLVVVVHGVEAVRRAATEVLVADAHAGVDDVRGDALTRGVRVGVLAVALGLGLVDAVQTPGRRRLLRGVDAEPVVLHHLGDGRVGGEPLRLGAVETAGREAVNGRGVGAVHLAAVPLGKVLAFRGEGMRALGTRIVLEHDDVAAIDRALGVRAIDGAFGGRRAGGQGQQSGPGGDRGRSGYRQYEPPFAGALVFCHYEVPPRAVVGG
ncbi:hypothetical protein GCM10020000_17580 [Streptomyces olivoverticillatus]